MTAKLSGFLKKDCNSLPNLTCWWRQI